MFLFCLFQVTFILFVASHNLLAPAVNLLVKAGKTSEVRNSQQKSISPFYVHWLKTMDKGRERLRKYYHVLIIPVFLFFRFL